MILMSEDKRLIWRILNEISRNQTIIITIQSMEEVAVLCHQIGIISHCIPRCYATPLHLKELYGSGFKFFYSNQPEHYRELKEYIKSILLKHHKIHH
ncbi:hypothetical protein H8356DRAFT_323856 [Neocallimastix lanati (nom. inval.)]|nr:hypothetical protein H8356DRAFT_323856 [Neocallimastix sp. JGI-2020a]